jgi:hypothetical protein
LLGVPGALAAAVLGWGYWHVSTHAALHASVYDLALKNERQAYGEVKPAVIVFNDAAGSVLGRGKVEAPIGVFSIEHPQVGDCRREEREQPPTGWKRCFETQSRWLATWVRQARSAEVSFAGCRIERVPVTLDEYRDAWWLWWIPLPHVGGAPYTSFHANVWVDSRTCRASAAVR